MSLVGTRPILQDELQKYELHHRARIAIKPGITGMWQAFQNGYILCMCLENGFFCVNVFPVSVLFRAFIASARVNL